jgi:HEAT repeat protein/glycosyltransferase A (GT-A) superfamily protein (DUF2064 family)
MCCRGILILPAGLLFAAGLGLGWWLAGTPQGRPAERAAGEPERPPSWEELEAAVLRLRGLWDSAFNSRGEGFRARSQTGEFHGDRGLHRKRSREEILHALGDAVAAGDVWEARNLLRALEQAAGEPLAPEQLAELSSLFDSADRDLLRALSRTLAIAGGAEGLSLVMDFLEDPSAPLERRRQALDGLSDLPPEKAAEVIPVLAEFLARAPPLDLERTAARVIGQLAGETAVETLLGLLEVHPGIRAEGVFDAIGDLGGNIDSKRLLALLEGDWTAGGKMSLLRSQARLAARSGDGAELLGLLREPPPGVSREMVARALGDASRELGAGLLRDALRETAGDRQAQEAIARALLWTGGKESLDLLLEAARDPEARLDARLLAQALNDFQGQAAVPLMLELFLGSRDEEVLRPLARGLARNASSESMEGLLGLLEAGGDAWQRRALAQAVQEGSSAALGAERLFDLLRREKDQEVASSLARALSRLHPGAIEGRVAELFEQAASPVERIAFAQMLERTAAPGAAETLGRQLREETDSRARWEIARVLGRIGEEGVAQVADSLRREPDERSRHALLWGLEASRRPVPAEARTLFIEAASGDPSPSIRAQAAEILGRQQDPVLIPVLRGLLGAEEHRDVRERIERALRELEARR